MKQFLEDWWNRHRGKWVSFNENSSGLALVLTILGGLFSGLLYMYGWFGGDETKDATPTTQGENTNNATRSEEPDNTKDLIREEPQITNEFNDNATQGDYSNTNNNFNKQTDIPSDIYERGKLERAFRDATSNDPSVRLPAQRIIETTPLELTEEFLNYQNEPQ